MHKLRFLAVGLALSVLAACSPPEAAHDVAFYRDHPQARAAKLSACRNDPGRLAATDNCVNALGADSAAVSKQFWNKPRTAPRVANPGAL
jgi:hypothetical protein